jgi:nucleoside-diphosphate-sugar epimerase
MRVLVTGHAGYVGSVLAPYVDETLGWRGPEQAAASA